jgi:hypothetical protein
MFSHSTNTASSFFGLIAALIFSLSLAGVAAAQDNTSFGTGALQNNTTGSFNTASGVDTLFSNSTGSFNTASGVSALVSNTTGIQNTASGVQALRSNTTGSNNTASGVNALVGNTTGDGNTASGVTALFNNGGGRFNTASGFQALFNNTGDFNTASGANALVNNTTGNGTTASGFEALLSNTDGDFNTASGYRTLRSNTVGVQNTANGFLSLFSNTIGNNNTASGTAALQSNTTGGLNTGIGAFADVMFGNLSNATAIGSQAIVNASNKVRLGNTAVTVIEGQVAFTFHSDKTQKENFQPVDGEEVLWKIRGFELSSWNFIGHDPKKFRHYGPMAQDFFAAFGNDGIGQIGTETTINSGDIAGILMIAVQALEKRTAELKQKQAQIAVLESRLEALEQQKNHAIQIAAEVLQ